jgi:glycosyltransferase involved in cell wall biosynthesis
MAAMWSTARVADGSERARVLILRSCRMPQFERAVAHARAARPRAEIVALTHRGHQDALRAAGVDRVIEIPGCRFGILRVAPWRLRRLRRERFDEVVIPQMEALLDVNRNLHRFAAMLRGSRFTIIPGEAPPIGYENASAFRRSLVGWSGWPSLLSRVDAPVFVLMLAAACVARRRPVADEAPRKRRVLLVISSLGLGGAQVQLAELLNRLPRDEYDVDLLALGRDGEFSRQWLTRDDVEVAFVKQWPRLVPSVLEIKARCEERQYDLVHTWLFMANAVGVAAARLAGVPAVIASVRNLSVWKRERWYRKWWHRPADVLGSHAADLVTVNARALVKDHARWALMRAAPIEVVHNGLDPSRIVADRDGARRSLLELCGAPSDAVLVGAVGRLALEKDHATFIRLIAALRQERPDVRGVVIGDGELRARLETIAAGLGLGRLITFTGARTDARTLMAGLDALVLTSLSEGFPNVLLEAAFLGVPSVATNLAGNPDVLHFEELLFPAKDAEAGAARVLALLGDREQTRRMTHAVQARALSLFTSARSVAAWLALYDRRLETAARRAHAAHRAAVTLEAR